MAENGSFKYGGAVYPLPSSTANPLLKDADPSLYYVIDYFQSVLNTYMAPRLMAEVARTPVIPNITAAISYVVPYDPLPVMEQLQLKFPLLAVYRRKDKFNWKTIAYWDDVSEWCVDYILPPLTAGQKERIEPILRSVGPILLNRIENMSDPFYQSGAPVWQLAGLEAITLDEANYGSFAGTNNLIFPAWRGKLSVKEIQDFSSNFLGLQPLAGIDDTLIGMDTATMSSAIQMNLVSTFTTKNFFSGFAMQVQTTQLTVPVSITAPANVSGTVLAGIFFPGSLFLQVDGTFVGTYAVEGSVDGITWTDMSKELYNASTGIVLAGDITTTGLYGANLSVAWPPNLRVRCVAYTSGTPIMQISGIV